MEDYDQTLIKAAFPDFTHGAMHALRTNLMDEVIRYLVDFAEHDGRRDLYQLLSEGKYLRASDMYALATNRLHNAIHLAIEMEAMAELIEAIHEAQTLLDYNAAGRDEVDELMRVEAWAIAGLAESTEINRLHAEFFRVGRMPAAEGLVELDRLAEQVAVIPQPSLVRNQIKLLRVHHSLHKRRSEPRAAMGKNREIISLAESHSHVLADASIRDIYFRSVTFLAVAHADFKEYEQSDAYLDKLKTLAKRWGGGLEENPSLHAFYLYSQIVGKVARKDWKAAYDIAKNTYKDVVQKGQLRHAILRSPLVYFSAMAAFFYRDFGLARKLLLDLKSWLGTTGMGVNRASWVARIGLVYLLSYIEENDEHLGVAIKNTQSWMRTFGPLGEFESTMLEFIKQMSEEAGARPTASSLQSLRAQLESIFEIPHFRRYKDMFPFMAWIDSKLQGKDLRQVDFE